MKGKIISKADFFQYLCYYLFRASSDDKSRRKATPLIYDDKKKPVANPITIAEIGPFVAYTILVCS